jgi:hypothetical protein
MASALKPVLLAAGWSAALGFGSAPLAAAPMAEALQGSVAGVFRYATAGEQTSANCVGVFVAPGWAITASHCLKGTERRLLVVCEAAGRRAQTPLSVRTFYRHPSHDVVLLNLAPSTACAPPPISIATTIAKRTSLEAVRAPRSDGAKNSGREVALVREIVRDEYTITTDDRRVCFARGDSGTPLFVRAERQSRRLAAILISGVEACAEHTFVRLDALRPWIETSIKSKD